MLNLVLVSSTTIVSRHFEITNAEIMREIVGDTGMMRQVLVLDGSNVIFETVRGENDRSWKVAEVREILKCGTIQRCLTDKEVMALNAIRYKA